MGACALDRQGQGAPCRKTRGVEMTGGYKPALTVVLSSCAATVRGGARRSPSTPPLCSHAHSFSPFPPFTSIASPRVSNRAQLGSTTKFLPSFHTPMCALWHVDAEQPHRSSDPFHRVERLRKVRSTRSPSELKFDAYVGEALRCATTRQGLRRSLANGTNRRLTVFSTLGNRVDGFDEAYMHEESVDFRQ